MPRVATTWCSGDIIRQDYYSTNKDYDASKFPTSCACEIFVKQCATPDVMFLRCTGFISRTNLVKSLYKVFVKATQNFEGDPANPMSVTFKADRSDFLLPGEQNSCSSRLHKCWFQLFPKPVSGQAKTSFLPRKAALYACCCFTLFLAFIPFAA